MIFGGPIGPNGRLRVTAGEVVALVPVNGRSFLLAGALEICGPCPLSEVDRAHGFARRTVHGERRWRPTGTPGTAIE
ncbi:hypothetical protein GCM10010321_74020 [Streptomyces chartreusis]|nr:hypothetical protein GCM10010321_74020 [Streptomyces chartreusis]